MRIVFSQTSEHRINRIINTKCLSNLPNVIYQHTEWNYTCEQTEGGCYLKPSFHNMPYRNAFVPEIDIGISQDNGQTILNMNGRPVKFIRYFMMVWFGFLLMMQAWILAIVVFSDFNSFFPVFIPVLMCVFGYLFCKITTKLTFQTIVKAIQKEFP